mmetsp:Transcript_38417/g.91122  ORF Transcript_38417/g.91122 Transcript_38417/m.91122 type:complete len:172 (+) Transcript_38417:576-1091(+)
MIQAAVQELKSTESPSREELAVCAALLTVVDYEAVVSEMAKREWELPLDEEEIKSFWRKFVVKGLIEISSNLLMLFDYVVPTDTSVANCARFERVETVLRGVDARTVAEKAPTIVQLLYQWLLTAQELNGLSVLRREAAVAARQFGDPPAELRPSQVTSDQICDVICRRYL